MNLSRVLQKAWQMLWNYRALWLFGAILALVGSSLIYAGPWPNPEDDEQWIKVKVSDTTTLRVPGGNVTVDLTAPDGVRITAPDGASWQEFHELVDELHREAGIDLWPILIEFGVILAGLFLLGVVARYIAETALIRMVDEADETGEHLSLRKGLRRGFSVRAWRLLFLDLVVGILAFLAFVIVFGLAVAPILLAIGSSEAVLITVAVATAGLFVLAICLWLAASLLLSCVLQPIRRACVLGEWGLWASIRQGASMIKHHFKEVGLVWLIWMGIRLAWVPLGALIVILLAPVLLLTVLAGIVVGGVPAGVVGAFTGLFTDGVTPWIMGALAGIPILIVVMISPLLFVNGLVEVYLSSIWTLAYRELRAVESPVQALTSQPRVVPAPGPAS